MTQQPDSAYSSTAVDQADSVIVIEPDDVLPPGDSAGDSGETADASNSTPWEARAPWKIPAPWKAADSGDDTDPEATAELAEDTGPGDAQDLAEDTDLQEAPDLDESPGLVFNPGEDPDDDELPEPVVTSSAALAPAASTGNGNWSEVLAGFVDDPRGSVETAGAMVDQEIADCAALLGRRQEELAATWQGSSAAGTEELRIALLAYRDLGRQLGDVVSQLS